jgi:hypothetical protein
VDTFFGRSSFRIFSQMKINYIFNKKVLLNKSGWGDVASGSCFRKRINHFKYIDIINSRGVSWSVKDSINDSIRELGVKGKHITELELGYVKTVSDEQLDDILKRFNLK